MPSQADTTEWDASNALCNKSGFRADDQSLAR
jgi:hypothetical protein